MPKINVNDIQLYYEMHGKGDPIIFISGFNSDHLSWANIINDYANDYTVILIDNRGSGRSDTPDMPYTIEMMADDVAELCKALALSSCHFIGSSMGSAIAQMLVHRHPALCKSIILCNGFTKIDIRFALFAKGTATLFAKNVERRAMIEMVLGWVFSSHFLEKKNNVETLIKMSLENLYPMTEVGYRNQLKALNGFNSEVWISTIPVPCLVIGSDQDMIVPEAHMRRMAGLIPQAAYYCFHDVGHLPHLEQPKKFNEIVKQFISRH